MDLIDLFPTEGGFYEEDDMSEYMRQFYINTGYAC